MELRGRTHFVNTNFKIPADFIHSTWIESKAPMSSVNGTLLMHQFDDTFSISGGLSNRDLSLPDTSIRLPLANLNSWTEDPFESNNFMVQQSIVERSPAHLYRIVLVVDTSDRMERAAHDLQKALRSIPSHFDVKLVLANADGKENLTASGVEEISSKIGSANFGGGADNTPALVKAWDLAAEKPGNNVIVWVHGPQLMQLEPIDYLKQRWEARPFGPVLYSVRTTAGSDEIEKRLDGIN